MPDAAREPDLKAAVRLVTELMAVPGKSGEEAEIVNRVRQKLLDAGAPEKAITTDNTHKKSPLGGNSGSLILKLPGTQRGPRRLLMAHVDTVPLCVGSKPVRRNNIIEAADPHTALGADDRAGASVVLTAALEILRHKLPHPPLTFFWPVQEEVGLFGARLVPLSKLGNPKLAFNYDGGAPEKLTVGATGAYRIAIEISGLASHAGGAPEKGVSAITIASLAIADLHQNGWLGDVHQNGKHGTSNVGVIRGGDATNVITDKLNLRAECRSHDARFRARILKEFQRAFERAVKQVHNVDGQRGSLKFESQQDYESFKLADDEPCVLAAEAAAKAIGLEPSRAITNGGVDANWLSARGIPTVTMGCGQREAHTVKEHLVIADFENACRMALRLATAVD